MTMPPAPDLPPREDSAPILTEIRGLRGDTQKLTSTLATERVGRRQSNRNTRIAGLLALVVACIFGVNRIQSGQISCEQRAQSRADQRAAISAAADEVASFARVGADDRAELNSRVAARVAEEIGPPDC